LRQEELTEEEKKKQEEKIPAEYEEILYRRGQSEKLKAT
jgi:hypothetical protein